MKERLPIEKKRHFAVHSVAKLHVNVGRMDPLAQRLRSERERQGLSVRDLAVVTKIREPYIDAIERGRYDVLPAVYVRSFMRTLGTALGISAQEIHQLMDDVFDLEAGETPERLPAAKVPSAASGPNFTESVARASEAMSASVQKAGAVVADGFSRARDLMPPTLFFHDRQKLMIISGIVGVVVLVFIAWLVFSSGDDKPGNLLDRASTEITVGGNSGLTLADSMMLTAEVVDSAWLTITMDGARTQQMVLVPGEEYEWRGSKTFVLSLNNAGGVRFFRDGEALPLFGQKGQAVRRVTITRTEVVSSIKATPGQPVTTMPQTQAAVQTPQTAPSNRPTTVAQPVAQPKPAVQRRPTPAPQRTQRRVAKPTRRQMPMITPAPTRQQPIRPPE